MRFIALCIALTLLLFSFRTGMGASYQGLGESQDLSTQQEQQPATQGETLNDLSDQSNNLAEEELFVVLLRPPQFVLQQEPSSAYDLLLLSYSAALEIHTPPPEA
jgi:hypothetical protein